MKRFGERPNRRQPSREKKRTPVTTNTTTKHQNKTTWLGTPKDAAVNGLVPRKTYSFSHTEASNINAELGNGPKVGSRFPRDTSIPFHKRERSEPRSPSKKQAAAPQRHTHQVAFSAQRKPAPPHNKNRKTAAYQKHTPRQIPLQTK